MNPTPNKHDGTLANFLNPYYLFSFREQNLTHIINNKRVNTLGNDMIIKKTSVRCKNSGKGISYCISLPWNKLN